MEFKRFGDIMIGIVVFAMIALFLGLRLYAVLGKRTGHEQPLSRPPEDMVRDRSALPSIDDARDGPVVVPEEQHVPGADAGLRAIAAADRSFNSAEFLEGAKQAYKLILEAFWAGKEDDFRAYVSNDVGEAFGEAMADRKSKGHVLDNRMVRIERCSNPRYRGQGNCGVAHRCGADPRCLDICPKFALNRSKLAFDGHRRSVVRRLA
jgi:predicted lipid-binding transport protein (Tim44 family)